MASTTATTPTPSATTVWCRKCNVAERMVKGEVCLTPVSGHAIGCPKGAEDDEEPKFSFPPLCIECHNQEVWLKAYRAREADKSLKLPYPGAPRVHTCGR